MLETQKGSPPSIKQIIASDLRKYSEEMGLTLREVIKEISSSTNVNLRTLERLLEGNNKISPNVRTVTDIYAFIYKANTLAEVISKSPEEVSEFIKKNHTQFQIGNYSVSDFSKNPLLQASFSSSTIFNQIYILSSGNHGVELSIIRELYGLTGLKKLDEMIKAGFVEIDSEERIRRREKLDWNRSIRKNFANTLINDIYKEEHVDEENPNYLSFSIGEVTADDYKKIINKLKSNYLEIQEIINNSNPTFEEAIKISVAKVAEKSEFKMERGTIC